MKDARNNILKYIPFIIFGLYFLIALFVVRDYGIGIDEVPQRNHSLIAYKYINQVLFDRAVKDTWSELPELETYEYRQHGTAVQLPMVFIEDIFDFERDSSFIYTMRHVCTFLICFTGYIFFYLSLRKLFPGRNILPVIGALFLMLYPRFFALQFTDIKNLVFAALTMVTLFFMIQSVEKRRIPYYILFGIAAAFASNVRIMAVIYPCILLGYFVLNDLLEGFHVSSLPKYAIVAVSYFLCWVLIFPTAWSHPFQTFLDVFTKFSSWDMWDGTMVFMGHTIMRADMPWYYLPVWMGITIPVYLIVLFIAGHISFVTQLIKSKKKIAFLLVDGKWQTCMLTLFWGIFLNIVLRKGCIYIGWHHVYFIMVPFVVISVQGVVYLCSYIKQKYMYALLGGILCLQAAWIGANHPYQMNYFNLIGKAVAPKFDRCEERTECLAMLRWLAAYETYTVSVYGEIRSLDIMPPEERARFMTGEPGEARYDIRSYRGIIGNTYEMDGYEEIHAFYIDGFKVGSVFKKLD